MAVVFLWQGPLQGGRVDVIGELPETIEVELPNARRAVYRLVPGSAKHYIYEEHPVD